MAYFYLFFAQLMVAINVVGSKYLVGRISVLSVLVYRFAIATFFLLFFHWVRKPKNTISIRDLSSLEWRMIIAQSLCAGVLFNALLLIGLKYTQAVMAGMLISVLPALIALAAIIFLREKLTFITGFCICFAVVGLLILNGRNFQLGQAHQFIGDLIIFCSLLPEVVYYLLSKVYKNRLPLFLLSALMNGLNLLCLLPLFVFLGAQKILVIDAKSLQVVICTGLASAYFYITWYLGSQQIKASRSGIFTAFAPVLTTLLAVVFLGESVLASQFFAMSLIIISVIVSSFKG